MDNPFKKKSKTDTIEQTIKKLAAGKVTLEELFNPHPFYIVIVKDGKYSVNIGKDKVVYNSKEELMEWADKQPEGKLLWIEEAPNCLPLETDPEEFILKRDGTPLQEKPGVFERIKNAVSDFLTSEPVEPTVDEKRRAAIEAVKKRDQIHEYAPVKKGRQKLSDYEKAMNVYLYLTNQPRNENAPDPVPGHDFAIAGFDESYKAADSGEFDEWQEQKEIINTANYKLNGPGYGIQRF